MTQEVGRTSDFFLRLWGREKYCTIKHSIFNIFPTNYIYVYLLNNTLDGNEILPHKINTLHLILVSIKFYILHFHILYIGQKMMNQSRNMLLKLLAIYCIENKSFVDGVEVPLTDCKKNPWFRLGRTTDVTYRDYCLTAKKTKLSKNMHMTFNVQCVQCTSELPLKEWRSAYILRVLTDSLRMDIREITWDTGILINVVPVSMSAEHGETALASHLATSCDPNLNLHRIAIWLEESWYCIGML